MKWLVLKEEGSKKDFVFFRGNSEGDLKEYLANEVKKIRKENPEGFCFGTENEGDILGSGSIFLADATYENEKGKTCFAKWFAYSVDEIPTKTMTKKKRSK